MLKRIFALLLIALSATAAADKPRIRILSTEPKITGPALTFAEAMLDRAGLAYSVETVPWARAYRLAQQDPDVLLVAVGRTPEREHQFVWIGESFPVIFKAYRLQQRADITIHAPADLRRYRLSVVRDAAIVPYLHALGIKEGDGKPGLQLIADVEDHWPKLQHDRVDLFIAPGLSVASMCTAGRLDCTQITPAWTFDDLHAMAWLAFSSGTPDAVITRASAAYQSLRNDGSFERALAPLLSPHPP